MAIPENPSLPLVIAQMESAARRLSLATSIVYAGSPGDFEGALAEAIRLRSNGISVLPDPTINTNSASLAALAMRHRVPSIGGIDLYAERGVAELRCKPHRELPSRGRAGRQNLEGPQGRRLPVEQPTKFSLIVSLKTARALGLTIPQTILVYADKVIH